MLLNKVDMLEPGKRDSLVGIVRSLNPLAQVNDYQGTCNGTKTILKHFLPIQLHCCD